MTKIYRILFPFCWALGLLSILAGVVIKALALDERVHVTGRTAFVAAGAFFLCALATREMQRAQSS